MPGLVERAGDSFLRGLTVDVAPGHHVRSEGSGRDVAGGRRTPTTAQAAAALRILHHRRRGRQEGLQGAAVDRQPLLPRVLPLQIGSQYLTLGSKLDVHFVHPEQLPP